MRFYLSTLMLVVLLFGALMAVLVRWDAWYHYSTLKLSEAIKFRTSHVSPDKTRFLNLKHLRDSPEAFPETVLSISDTGPVVELCRIHEPLDPSNLYASGFVSDDELHHYSIFRLKEENAQVLVFRRRHPEWWWGHLYRPEVWASIALFCSLILQIRHSRKQQNAGR